MKVKICGITNAEDAHAAVRAGADALGFVFAAGSPRSISFSDAAAIIAELPPFVTPVGVFSDATIDRLIDAVGRANIRCLQIDARVGPADLARIPVPIIRSFRVRPDFDVRTLEGEIAQALLLDTYAKGIQGGTGMTFDWSVAAAASRYGRIILAGGLNPENVGEAVRIARPYAVDVSSGVESTPGKKDHARLSAFCRAARDAAVRLQAIGE